MTMLIIGGATATGKTALATACARRFGGEIISADSAQIYKGLDIGTAKASIAERQGVAHHLIDLLDADESFSVTDFRRLATAAASDIAARGKLPIVAGGTGFYINSLIFEQDFGVNSNDGLRESLFAELDAKGLAHMHARLAEIDPISASKIHQNNTRRVVRAIEVTIKSGKPFSSQNADVQTRTDGYTLICLHYPKREEMYKKIEERVDIMLANGLENEVFELAKRVGFGVQAMQAIGYKEFRAYFEGEKLTKEGLAAVASQIKQNTRNYAKRQLTWFRRYKDAVWLDCTKPLAENVKIIESLLKAIL